MQRPRHVSVENLLDQIMATRFAPEPPRRSARAVRVDQPEEGLYIISVAARILRMHPQTLRKYERVGLVRPSRTVGMLRLYSELDIAKLRMIKHLVEELRLNLAGVELALAVVDRLSEARMSMGRVPDNIVRSFDDALRDIFGLFEGRGRLTPKVRQE